MIGATVGQPSSCALPLRPSFGATRGDPPPGGLASLESLTRAPKVARWTPSGPRGPTRATSAATNAAASRSRAARSAAVCSASAPLSAATAAAPDPAAVSDTFRITMVAGLRRWERPVRRKHHCNGNNKPHIQNVPGLGHLSGFQKGCNCNI